jgi:hypothetical protein
MREFELARNAYPPRSSVDQDPRENPVTRIQALLEQLRPACPRCGQRRPLPLAWGVGGIWFQCERCYKFWLAAVEAHPQESAGV